MNTTAGALATLLRLRQSLERQQELLVSQAAQRLALAEQQWEQARQWRQDQRLALDRELRAGLAAAELQAGAEQWRAGRLREQGLEARLATLREERRCAVAQLRQRVQERQTVESLQAQQQARLRREHERREQQQQDDAFAQRLRKF